MKKFQIVQESPKCDRETQSKQNAVGKNGANRLKSTQCCHRSSICKKNAISSKYNKGKHNKTRYACTLPIYDILI